MSKGDTHILFRRLFQSFLSSVISISLVLFMVGVAALLVLNASSVSDYFKENMTISAILSVEASDQEAEKLASSVEELPFIKSVTCVTKEQGVQEMKDLLGEDFLVAFGSAPIPTSLDLQLEADYLVSDSLKVVEERLMQFPAVEEVVYQESLVDLLNANLEKIGYFLLVLIVLLLFISFVLINNTVRLNVYAKRFSIHTMRLVGATKGFITRPFVAQAFYQGLISGLIAVLGLLGVLSLIRNEFTQLFMLFEFKILLEVMGIVVVSGVLICVLCTVWVVRRLINLNKDELYY
ncbi:MAG: permease-like cell division protein FtsX [Bacteroidales bacterium]|jgi:cell division transport system permease protein|nr:permease-like cell division protein FtsX [Bacteroidales bacterium]